MHTCIRPACTQGLEELALACFCEGKIVGDKLPSSAPECALSYAAIGGIFFHLEQYQVALNFFDKVRDCVRVRVRVGVRVGGHPPARCYPTQPTG